ncbi:hypothetical protein BDV32DRAFT_126482 [Aspergillus pseudonomiae]|nr:hypothetical protein BDV32DRAFT_126482 [Aspergillus pseudonomiae]
MAPTSAIEAVEISEKEHHIGRLSEQNLQVAKDVFELHGIVAWQNLWNVRKVDCETLRRLDSLPTEKNFILVNARSLLPSDVVSNRFVMAFLESQFPNRKLLQIYARHATTTGTLSLQSSNAIAPLLVQAIISRGGHPISMKLGCGDQYVHLTSNGVCVVRYSSTEVTVHVDSPNYTVVTLDYTY